MATPAEIRAYVAEWAGGVECRGIVPEAALKDAHAFLLSIANDQEKAA